MRTAIASIVRGTVSKLGGGKFSNGAVSASFVHMFNGEGMVNKAMTFGKNALTTIGGTLQVATGSMLIASGFGTPLGVVMVGLGVNNIVTGTIGYNAIQSGLSYASGGVLGAKTYAAIDLTASGGAMLTKIPKVINSITFGKRIACQPIYQTASKYGLIAESLVASNTIRSAYDQ